MTNKGAQRGRVMRFRVWAAGSASAVALLAAASPGTGAAAEERTDVAAAEPVAYDIAAQDLADALGAFALQSRLQLMFDPALVEGRRSPPLQGRYAPNEALERLLEGSGVEPGPAAGDALTLRAAAEPDSSGTEDGREAGPAEDGSAPFRTPVREADNAPADQPEVITVTGTHLRGVAPVGSQLFVMDRSELDRLGVGTVQEAIRILPQNFAGGVGGEDRRIGGGGTPVNTSGGAGVNLRGLGGEATLVLVNGRRMPQGAAPSGQFVDISSIPLSAVDRIEVLADGASALYGSDAIAGVVNFVLREDYDGAESRVRWGTVTEGGLRELSASHVQGFESGAFNLLAGYEFFDRTPLAAADRSYAADSDLSRFGGPDVGVSSANPANIDGVLLANGDFVGVVYAVPEGQDGTSLAPGDLIEGRRNFENSNAGRWLLADQQRHSVFATGGVDLTSAVRAFGELRWSLRDYETRQNGETLFDVLVPSSNPFFVSPLPDAEAVSINYSLYDDFGGRREYGDVTTLGGALGFSVEGERLRAEVYASHGRETTTNRADLVNVDRFAEALGFDDPATAFDPAVDGYYNPFADGSVSPRQVLDYIQGYAASDVTAQLSMARALAEADLLALPGGDVRIAVGAEIREERFGGDRIDFTSGLEPRSIPGDIRRREVSAVFGELLLPLVGDASGRPGLRELRLSLAGRYEAYSDFGSSADPKVGASWTPIQGLEFRGSYGRSFKAPKLSDFGENYSAVSFRVQDPTAPTPPGRSLALILEGENADLGPETSTSWTAGFSLAPTFAPDLEFDATWFRIDFEDRIGRLAINPFLALREEAVYASVITRNPAPDVVGAYIDEAAEYIDAAGGAALGDYRAIIDGRITNIAITEVSGIDATASYAKDTPAGELTLGLNASYLTRFNQAVASGAPLVEVLNTLNNPVDFRMRASVGLARDRWSASGFVTFVDSYRNTSFTPARSIDSWTTLDLQVAYDLGGRRAPWLEGVSASLSVQNALDEDPPFALDAGASVGLAYDSENADPLGRFVALQVVKTW